ncbi:MAG: CRISPR-associated endonuclease Cas1 [Rhodoplanes sp.]|uniref:CRISPR-associated endonuclease Cas1 n=1 Tax=Rhodoplanes sp. TaxID=1968906 RepID=UPI001836E26F|nr:CRISPR-associated endonuclease Cas1 [Rhodoplanes sp.]NVO14046.1 CRISPR-associated endonuclease Cas1 [Rhodoplanes sp.]
MTTPKTVSGPLYDRVAAVDTLRQAWEKVKANNGAAGGDGMTVARFALVAESMIERLAQGLRTGQYRPGPARRVLIPKTDGGVRPLDIPCVHDRVVQGAATLVLDPVLDREFADSSFAYRRGRSVAQAVARIGSLRRQGFTHVVDGDIRAYFERIPHDRLIAKLEEHVDDHALVDLIWLWLETYSLTGRGVPQGAPISPLLANLYLDTVDDRIERAGVRLVRFADDFVLLTKTPASAETALAEMTRLLAAEGLEIHPDKTRLVSFEEGFRFLGHVFVRSLVVREVQEEDIPAEDAIAAAEGLLAKAEAADAAEAPEPGAATPRERSDPVFPVYVIEPGRRLEAKGARLRLIDEIGRIVDLPPGRIDRIELGPGTDATLEALELAAANAIEVDRVNGHGEVTGRYEDVGPERARRHLAQARTVLDPARRLAVARAIVDGRLRNQRALLRRLNRRRKDPEIAKACVVLNRTILKLAKAADVGAAMGFEGAAGAVFWPAFGRCFPEPFRFGLRRRRPVADAANLAINVTCNMLARDIRAVVMRAGLHPGFGALHETRDGIDAVVHDLMEEFRAPVAEACVAAAFNRKALSTESFTLDPGPRLTREGWAALIRAYEAWVAQPIRSPRSERDVLWRALMLEQAQAYAEACEGDGPYRPYQMDY